MLVISRYNLNPGTFFCVLKHGDLEGKTACVLGSVNNCTCAKISPLVNYYRLRRNNEKQ